MDNYFSEIYHYEARSAELQVLSRLESACAIGKQYRWYTHNNHEAFVVRGPPVAKRPG